MFACSTKAEPFSDSHTDGSEPSDSPAASRICLFALLACGDDDTHTAGDVACNGSECQCPSTGDCRVDCARECDLSCTGSGDCDFQCGEACEASCPGSGACVVAVGHGSSVDCSGSGGCDVSCSGDCSVDCPGSGECIVRCAQDADCSLMRCENPTECSQHVWACNGPCPDD